MAEENVCQKRKRPSYVDTFDESLLDESGDEDEPVQVKKGPGKKDVPPDVPSPPSCSLCTHSTSPTKWSLTSTVGTTKLSFSELLNKTFQEKQPTSGKKQRFYKGNLCNECKDLVNDLQEVESEVDTLQKTLLNKLQKKQKTVKNSVPKKPKGKSTPPKKPKTLNDSGNKSDKPTPKTRRDNVFIIESLRKKRGKHFLVKWANIPEEENTWEPMAVIPSYILKFYEDDLSRLGEPIPGYVSTHLPKLAADSSKKIIEILKQRRKEESTDKKVEAKKSLFGSHDEDLVDGDEIHKKSFETMSENVSKKSQNELFDEIFGEVIKISPMATVKSDKKDETANNKVATKKRFNGQKIEDDEILKESKKDKISSNKENKPTKKQNKPTKKDDKFTKSRNKEDSYNIETLVEKKGSKYLVKWENVPDDQNTWEPRTSIPYFILKYFEVDQSRLGTPAPTVTTEDKIDPVYKKMIQKRKMMLKYKIF